jgi:hypothetical protein
VKKLLIITLLLGIYTSTHAQFIKNIGIKVGGTVSSQKWEYVSSVPVSSLDPDSKIGFNIGAFAEFLNLPFISVIGEINYVEKGIQKEIHLTDALHPEGNGQTAMWKAGVNYLDISLLGKVRLDGIIFTPYIIAGPRFDIEISKNEGAVDAVVFDDFSKGRFGFKAGIGTEVKLFKITFLAEVLYDADFGNVFESSILKVYSSAIDFRTGVSIGL